MGASQSIPRTLTHQQLFELTKDTRNVMNILLEYMLKELSVRDFLSLSNPTECKKYVLFMANNLYQHFYELQIYPTQTKQGVIVFRKAQDLTNPPNSSTDQEKQSLCLILAYYYTRIFQIYGALALTLLDDMQLASQTGMIPMFTDPSSRLLPPGQRQYFAAAGDLSLLALGNFSFLRGYLTNTTQDGFFVTKYTDTRSKPVKVLFKKAMTNSSLPSTIQKGTFQINITGMTPFFIDIYAAKEGNNINIEFQSIRYTPKGTTTTKTSVIPSNILSSKLITVQIVSGNQGKEPTYTIPSYGKSVPAFLQEFFYDLVPHLRTFTSQTSQSVVESGVAEELRLSRTVQNLTKTKPLGHCIARALQLLENQPLDDKNSLTYICRAKFLETATTTNTGVKVSATRSGIPEPGSSLDTSPGLAALSQLFYEIVFEATPRLAISQQKAPDGISSWDEYRTFMKNMALLFGDTKDPLNPSQTRSINQLQQLGLKGLKNKRDKDACKEIQSTDRFPIPSAVGKEVSQYVERLFQLQLQHAAKCGAIFQQLFSIQRDKNSRNFKISLNDNIIRKGFPEIQRINTMSRRLLVDYYTRCEDTYQQGMKRIIDFKKTTLPRTNPTTTAPLPAT
jgi:hypothetical protein